MYDLWSDRKQMSVRYIQYVLIILVSFGYFHAILMSLINTLGRNIMTTIKCSCFKCISLDATLLILK